MAEAEGYSEVNLNVGCPSDRVQNNMIGACLMAHPQLVADCVAAMRAAVRIPVTVKCRTGIDDMDSEDALAAFISSVADGSGCSTFIVHARIAVLQGLSPKENREVPPLNYTRVHRIKQRFPQLEVIINGGIRSLDQAAQQLQQLLLARIGQAAAGRVGEVEHEQAGLDRMLAQRRLDRIERHIGPGQIGILSCHGAVFVTLAVLALIVIGHLRTFAFSGGG